MQDAVLSSLGLYAFRISKLTDLELQTTYDHLVKQYPWIVVSQECYPVKHLHGIVGVPSKDTDEKEKAKLRLSIQKLYPKAKGNKYLYTANVQKKRKVFQYTIKEGNYLFSKFSKQFIEEQHKLSSSKEKLADKVTQNEEDLILGKIHFSDFKERYLQIKIDHNQNIYIHHTKAYFNRFLLRSGTMSIIDFITVMEL